MTDVSEQVATIIEAAERTAHALRERAEERARDRIAEADRAADHRLQAALEDAEEIRRKAEARAQEIVRDAEDERRRMVARANAATSEAVARGEELGEALSQLGSSLQTNARRVLDDVRRAHTHLRAHVAEAEATTVDDGGAFKEPIDEFRVPRFVRRG
jgi:cell division septum initiation protein DivIVA